jgi:hypothetical protein
MIIADIMIVLMALAVLGALAAVALSVWHSLKMNKRRAAENGVPVGIIDWAIIGVLTTVCLITWLVWSFTDMCIITAAVMLTGATATILYDKLKKRPTYA